MKNKQVNSCNQCDRDIVDSYNSADWVQLNQPEGGGYIGISGESKS